MKRNKKGQIRGLTPAILSLVVAIIVLVMGLVIIQEIRDTDIVDRAESSSFINETLTTVTSSGENLVCNSNPSSICFLGIITNETSGTVIPTTNYTQTNCNLVYSGGAGDSLGIDGSDWNATYSCTFGGESFTATNTSLVGLGDFADFIPIIVIAIAASIIIGLILFGFAFGRRER